MTLLIHKTLKIVSFCLLLGIATGSNACHAQELSDAIQDSLVAWSSHDFSEHGPSVESVRNVHVRFATLSSGERSYVLCGQFHAVSDNADAVWTHFATIMTDPYEQWVGAMAESHCERAQFIDHPKDLSAALQSSLHAAKSK